MAVHHNSRVQRAVRGARLDLTVTMCGLALAAAVAAGFGVWQMRYEPANRPTAIGMDRGATTEEYPEMNLPAHLSPTPTPSVEAGTAYLYLVDSEERAAFIRRWVAELNALRAQAGQPAVAAAAWANAPFDADAPAGLPAAPGTRILDLRAP